MYKQQTYFISYIFTMLSDITFEIIS
uniref:Uncharacterized protein n=1 Tax=Arundo donax TaxID=35708 RepID=A0A0A9G1F8_ARUDO